MDKEFLEFGKFSMQLLAKHVEKYLGSLPSYEVELRPCQKYDRSDVPFNVERLGLFVFFEEGIKQRLLEPLQKNNNRVFALGDWICALIHDEIHLYQEIPFQRIYRNEKKRTAYFKQYSYWIDGLAEYLAWKISLELYGEANDEGNYWKKRKSLKDVMMVLKLRRYKLGIRRRTVCIAVMIYFLLLGKGLERYFILPDFVPDDIKREISLAIKEKKCSFRYPQYRERIFKSILRGDKKTINLFLHYAIGFACIAKIMEKKGDCTELLNNPRNNKQLLELARIQIE